MLGFSSVQTNRANAMNYETSVTSRKPTRGLTIYEACYSVRIVWQVPGEPSEQTEIIVRGRATMTRAADAVKQWAFGQGKICRVIGISRHNAEDVE